MPENSCNCSSPVHTPDRTLVSSHGHYSGSESILIDPANPPHYTRLTPQPIDIIRAWGLDYEEGMVLKYLSRWKHKNGLEDLQKAKRSLEMLIEREANGK